MNRCSGFELMRKRCVACVMKQGREPKAGVEVLNRLSLAVGHPNGAVFLSGDEIGPNHLLERSTGDVHRTDRVLEPTVGGTRKHEKKHIVLENGSEALKEMMVYYGFLMLKKMDTAVDGIHDKPIRCTE